MSHPYVEFEGTMLWEAIDTGIAGLEKNGDIKLTTERSYIIGSLCKRLVRKKLIAKISVVKK
jgi:hypothetical protein